MPALFWLVADPTAQMLAGEIAVRLANPSLIVGLGLGTICQDAAYADGTQTKTEVIMAAATASSPRNARLNTYTMSSLSCGPFWCGAGRQHSGEKRSVRSRWTARIVILRRRAVPAVPPLCGR